MAKPLRKPEKKRRSLKDDNLPLQKQNFIVLGVGLLVIIVGYIALSQGPVDGFLPLVVAPILLVLGYCVLIPFGILFRPRKKPLAVETPSAAPAGPSAA